MAPNSPASKRLRTPKRFRTMGGVRRFVAHVLTELWNNKDIEPDRARVAIYGAKVLADLITDSELEVRMTKLEQRGEPLDAAH